MHLLIAAAGSGSRMGADRNKLLLKIAGKTVLEWTLKAAFASKTISWIGIIGQPKDKISICSIINDSVKSVQWIDGGSTRQQSVQLGLASLPDDKLVLKRNKRCLLLFANRKKSPPAFIVVGQMKTVIELAGI